MACSQGAYDHDLLSVEVTRESRSYRIQQHIVRYERVAVDNNENHVLLAAC